MPPRDIFVYLIKRRNGSSTCKGMEDGQGMGQCEGFYGTVWFTEQGALAVEEGHEIGVSQGQQLVPLLPLHVDHPCAVENARFQEADGLVHSRAV